MHRLLLLGLNHATAPLEVREKLAFNAEQRRDALLGLRQAFPETEAVLLSTCNRVELYIARATHGHPRFEEMAEFIGKFHGVDPELFRAHLYEKKEREAAGHLFTVTASLDSMVLGETQILAQVREAYECAREIKSAGSLLNPLFQKAIAVGKQVMTQTPIAEGRRSVASVAVDYAQQIFDHFADKTVLSIGAGKMAMLVLQGFAQLAPGKLLICNRDNEKARQLARKFNGEAVPFEQLADHLAGADVIVSSTGSSKPILTRSLCAALQKTRRHRPVFIIDIAMPRDVEPAVGELEDVYLYNLDDLQQVVSSTMGQRTDAIASARQIVETQVDDFLAWHRQREMGPVIDALYKRYHQIAQEEVGRLVHKLPGGEAERAHLEELARRLVNKLLHDPVHALRHADGSHAGASQYLHAMEQLFHLTHTENPAEDAADQETKT